MRCKLRLRPELAADSAADSMIENVGSSQVQYTLNHPLTGVIQLTAISFWGLRDKAAPSHKSTNKQIPSEASEET